MTDWTQRTGDGANPGGGRGRGLRAKFKEKEDAYTEALNLLEQFVEEGLKWAHEKDSSLTLWNDQDSVQLNFKLQGGSKMQVRVAGQAEAKALEEIMSESLGVSNFLRRQPGKEKRDGRDTYKVVVLIDEFPPERCVAALRCALRHIGCEPNGQGRYFSVTEEAEFHRMIREAEEDERNRGDDGTQRRRRISLD